MRSLILTAVALAMVVRPDDVRAGTSYTDESTFLAAVIATPTVIEFDSLAHLEVVDTQFPGVEFGSTGQVYDEASNPSGGAVFSAPNVLLNFSPAPIDFTFDPPVGAVGFYNTSIADREEVTLRDAQGSVIFTGELPEDSVNFLGFVSDTPIASGSVVGIPPQTFGTIFIDHFVFAPVASNVPALSAPGILLLGFCLLFTAHTMSLGRRRITRP